MHRASLHASDAERNRRAALNIGAARYLAEATPTIGNLIEYTQQSHSTTTRRAGNSVSTVRGMALVRANQEACAAVSTEQASLENGGSHGRVSRVKPDDVVRIMYENFSSLGVFGEGPTKHRKIRQINKLIKDYGVDIMAGYETRTDWRFVTMEANKFENLFGNGLPTKGVCASNTNDGKIKRDQWGGTCIMAVGRLSSFVTEVGVDASGLGRWAWVYVGGCGKHTRIITAYKPCNSGRRETRGGTVWNQHARYFEARGEIRNPRAMFTSDLLSLLQTWKSAGDEILLIGDFNENVNTGALTASLAQDGLRMFDVFY